LSITPQKPLAPAWIAGQAMAAFQAALDHIEVAGNVLEKGEPARAGAVSNLLVAQQAAERRRALVESERHVRWQSGQQVLDPRAERIGALVLVRHPVGDEDQSIDAGPGDGGEFLALPGRRVGHMARRNHGHPPRDTFDGEAGKVAPFRQRQMLHFRRLADSEQRMRPILDIPLDQRLVALPVDLIARREGRDHHRNDAVYPGLHGHVVRLIEVVGAQPW
jgi:hypothetical protein